MIAASLVGEFEQAIEFDDAHIDHGKLQAPVSGELGYCQGSCDAKSPSFAYLHDNEQDNNMIHVDEQSDTSDGVRAELKGSSKRHRGINLLQGT